MSHQHKNVEPPICNHVWRAYADGVLIWQVCDKCAIEQHVTTHVEQTAELRAR